MSEAQPTPVVPSSSDGASPGHALKERVAPPRMEHLPPYRVLLHNDDVNSEDWVVGAIVQLTPHPEVTAHALMRTAHETGVSLLLVTHKERAELYQEQFTSKGLTVTIEPA